jgi:DNA-binding transcriptional MerR regulator
LPDTEPLYNLKAVVQQTGIPAQSLRAWEKRYGIISPVRKPNGHRVYPRSEVEKLLRLKALMAQGMTIGQAAGQLGAAPVPPAPVAATEAERLRAELALALAACDGARANQVIGQAAELMTLPQLLLKLIRPLLPELDPFGRTYLRSRLGALLLQAAPPPGAAVALVMAPDAADLRPLVAALLLSRRDYRVIYVEGTVPPPGLKPDLTLDPRRDPEQYFQ